LSRNGIIFSIVFIVGLALLATLARRVIHGPPGSYADETRIVALSPALAIMLKDIGVEDQIVGRHGFDLVLDKSVPVCGDQAGIDYEQLLRVEPTHVLIEWGARELPPRLSELAGEHRWTVVDYSLETIDEIKTAADDLEQRFILDPALAKDPNAALSLAPLSDTITQALRPRVGAYEGRTLLLISANPPAALGPDSFHQDVLESLGGVSALQEGARYQELDAEDVLRLAPDAIVLIVPRSPDEPPTERDPLELLGVLATLEIPAVRNGRVALIDDPLALTPSSAVVRLAKEMGDAIVSFSEEREGP